MQVRGPFGGLFPCHVQHMCNKLAPDFGPTANGCWVVGSVGSVAARHDQNRLPALSIALRGSAEERLPGPRAPLSVSHKGANCGGRAETQHSRYALIATAP